MTGILIFVFLVVMYMLPTIIAARRKHINLGAIAALNILLGWFFWHWMVRGVNLVAD